MATPASTRVRRPRPTTRLLAMAGAIAAVLVASFALAGCSSGGGVQTVGPQDWIADSQASGAVIVDVRTPAEFAAGHVQGAINIDVDGATFDADIAKLDKNVTYTVYCHSGRRSGIATGKMGDAGFTHVVNLQGGIADLQSSGATITTS